MTQSIVARIVVAAIVVAGAGGYVFRAQLLDHRASRKLHSLLKVDRDYRFFDPWLVGTTHKPVKAATRTAGVDPERLAVAVRLRSFASELPASSGDRAAALGLSALYSGDPDTAIDLIREAVYQQPREASYWSDLAAAYLIRGRATDALQALDAADMAVELAPSLSPAAFNRALALQRLGLRTQAKAAWQLVDGNTDEGWIAEADERGDALSSASPASVGVDDLLAADHAQLTEWARQGIDRIRQLVEEDLMIRVAANCETAAVEQCTSIVKRVAAVAEAVAGTSQDKWWQALSAQVTEWSSGDGVPVADLRSYAEAMRLFSRDQVADAAKIFNELTARRGPPIISVYFNASYYSCVDYYFRGQNAPARQCLDALERQLVPREFLFMRGKVDWARAQISFAEGDLARAGSDFERGVAWLRKAGDTNQLAAIETLRASLRDQLGLFEEAWDDRIHALTHARLDFRRRHTLFTSAARSCLLQGLPRAALHFQQAAVENATEWGQPGALVEAHLSQASGLHRAGRIEMASQHVAAARKHFDEIADSRTQARLRGELAVTEGEVLVDTNPGAALGTLADAATTLTAQQFELLRARVEYATGIASERLGQNAAARAAFERGVAIIESQREPLAPSLQIQSIDLAWDTYDRLIARRLADDGTAAALAVAESVRAQVLRRFSASDIAAPTAEIVQASLPSDAVLIYFQVLDASTLRWTISRANIDAVQLPIGRAQIEYLVRRVQRALRDDAWQAELPAASAPLLELLLSGARQRTPDGTLIVVPDGALHELPFAALRDASTSRFLVEEHPLAVEPSLRAFLTASHAAEERFAALRRALVVEGRTGALDGQPFLPPLASGEEEIRTVANIYSESRVLAGAEATPERFLAEAGEFPIVHFTGHAMADRLSPDLSRLFLSPSASVRSGWLLFRDLEAATFTRTGLVVLAACSTGAGRIYRGEGAISLARPFLGKGAAGVVYTLWDVSDVPSTRLLTAFHHRIHAGSEPVLALQQAQKDAIAHSQTADDVRTWAAFQYAGGISARRAPTGESTHEK